jgi:hypothetical protein
MLKRQQVPRYYVINGWKFMPDRSKINDHFKAGDLARLYAEIADIKQRKRRID